MAVRRWIFLDFFLFFESRACYRAFCTFRIQRGSLLNSAAPLPTPITTPLEMRKQFDQTSLTKMEQQNKTERVCVTPYPILPIFDTQTENTECPRN